MDPGTKPREASLPLSPVRRGQARGPVALPDVMAPRIDDIVVNVPAPAAITPEDVQRRFMALARKHAAITYRTPNDKVEPGDEVLLDIIGYSRRRLIPFGTRADTWLPVKPDPLLPGFYESLVGQQVRRSLVIKVTLPGNHPVPALRGAPARFIVDLKAARVLQPLEPDSPRLLQALGRGKTRDEVMKRLLQEMREEQAMEQQLAARQRVLDELATRTAVEIPASLIDEELQRRWATVEGRTLVEKGFSNAEQQEAIDGWLKNDDLRRKVEWRLRIALGLGAICAQEKLTLTPQYMKELLEQSGARLGTSLPEMLQALKREPKTAIRLEQTAWHLMAVDHVMGRVKVHFEQA